MGEGVTYCECKYANFKLFYGNKSIQNIELTVIHAFMVLISV